MRWIPKHLRKEIGRCRSCKELIWWGYRYGHPVPFDVGFENDGTPYRRKLHRESCPFASDYQPRSRGNLRARADAHTEAVNQWKASCDTDKVLRDVDWTTLAIYDVPEKHAVRVAVTLVERGGPFERWHAMDTIRHFYGIAVEEKMVVALLIKPALFNRVHQHLHGGALPVFGDMSERKPVWVAGYRLEPSSVLQDCNPATLQNRRT